MHLFPGRSLLTYSKGTLPDEGLLGADRLHFPVLQKERAALMASPHTPGVFLQDVECSRDHIFPHFNTFTMRL